MLNWFDDTCYSLICCGFCFSSPQTQESCGLFRFSPTPTRVVWLCCPRCTGKTPIGCLFLLLQPTQSGVFIFCSGHGTNNPRLLVVVVLLFAAQTGRLVLLVLDPPQPLKGALGLVVVTHTEATTGVFRFADNSPQRVCLVQPI